MMWSNKMSQAKKRWASLVLIQKTCKEPIATGGSDVSNSCDGIFLWASNQLWLKRRLLANYFQYVKKKLVSENFFNAGGTNFDNYFPLMQILMLFQEGCGWHQCHINSDQAVDVRWDRQNQNHSKLRMVVGYGKSNLSRFFVVVVVDAQ